MKQRLMLRKAPILLALVALAIGCGKETQSPQTANKDVAGDSKTPPLPPEAAPIIDGIMANFEARGVPEDERDWALYRYPRVVAAGEAVIDAEGILIGEAPAAAVVWWADMAPHAMWMHPGRLFFADPDTGEVLAAHRTFWWPTHVGDDPEWGLLDDDESPDAVVPPKKHSVKPGAAQAPGKKGSVQAALVEGGDECTPTRHAFLVFGMFSENLEADAWPGNQALMTTLVGQWGVSDTNIHTVMPKRFEEMTLKEIDKRITAAGLKCCDEVIFYYFGHGWQDREDQEQQELEGWNTDVVGLFLGPNNKIDGEDLAKVIEKAAACKWLLLFDNCFAGGVAMDVVLGFQLDPDGSNKDVSIAHAVAWDTEGTYGTFSTAPMGDPGGKTVSGSLFTQVGLGSLGAFEPKSWEELQDTIEDISSKSNKGYKWGIKRGKPWKKTIEDKGGSQHFDGEGPCCQCKDNADCKPQPTDQCLCKNCVQGTCVEQVAEHKSCNDGKVCTEVDRCNWEGKCVGVKLTPDGTVCGSVGDCKDMVCKKGECDDEKNKKDGLQCNDGSVCTDKDKCMTGICAGTTISNCCVEDADCTATGQCNVGFCNASSTCDYSPKSGQCNDGDKCTNQDGCENGECKGKAIDCDDGNPCTEDECVEGVCSYVGANGAECEDGDPCTGPDACSQSGKTWICKGVEKSNCCKTAAECDDKNPCTDDTCPANTCVHQSQVGTCDDKNPCTAGDHCEMGQCVGTPQDPCCTKDADCADGKVCTTDVCNAAGSCVNTAQEGSCDDGDKCTGPDACEGKECKGAPTNCDDGNECTTDSCDAATGNCKNDAVPGTPSCNDNNECTAQDICSNKKCHGNEIECVDGKVCTADECDPTSGCKFPHISGPCEDGNDCTFNDQCQDGTCMSGITNDCDDGNECTQDSCVPASGCSNEELAMGTPCSQGVCEGGQCMPVDNPCDTEGAETTCPIDQETAYTAPVNQDGEVLLGIDPNCDVPGQFTMMFKLDQIVPPQDVPYVVQELMADGCGPEVQGSTLWVNGDVLDLHFPYEGFKKYVLIVAADAPPNTPLPVTVVASMCFLDP